MNAANSLDPTRVVVGVDGSAQSKDALRWAAHFAETEGARVEVIAAWDLPTSVMWTTQIIEVEDGALATERALAATVDDVFEHGRPSDITLIVRQGNAARVLLEASAGAKLLVVGSRGLGGFTGLLLGSVSARVSEHAHCPVLVMHGEYDAAH